ncbi:MAG: hypothetical protein ABJA71_14675 [Ginsengibacter sp.]
MPENLLTEADFSLRGIYWLLLPVLVLAGMYYVWKRWGKDEEVVVQAEFCPPENISPAISAYIIDGRLDRHDLTELIPYWGAGGYMQINELETKYLLGLIKTNEYEFVKLKDLPESSHQFEKTLFGGIFGAGRAHLLKRLKGIQVYE